MKNKKKLLIPLILALFGLFVFGTTYAFFSATVNSTNKTNTVLRSQGLTLTFRGTNEVVNCSNIIPGDKCIKEFEVQNTSNVETYFNIYMEDVENGFNSDLVYTLKEGNTEVITETVAPETNEGKTYIKTGVTIPGNATKSYTLTIEFKHTDSDQNINQGKEFRTTVGIDTEQMGVVKVISGGSIDASNIADGTSITKTFKIQNLSNEKKQYDVTLSDVVNTYSNGLQFSLSKNGTEVISTRTMPTEDTTILENQKINANVTDTYVMTISYDSSISYEEGYKLLANEANVFATTITLVTKQVEVNDSILGVLAEADNTLTQITVNEKSKTYPVHYYYFDGDQNWTTDKVFGDANDVATADSEAQKMVVVKVNGNLTIGEDVTVSPFYTEYGGPKGFLLYVTGTLTNNGTIDNSHGAKATGEDVWLYKKSNGDYEYVPAVGASGGAGVRVGGTQKIGNDGKNASEDGITRGTGGGGSGSALYGDCGASATSAAGGKGTSYSGGVGSGSINLNMRDHYYGVEVSNAGGAGGVGTAGRTESSWAARQAAGGAGNPGGYGAYTTTKGRFDGNLTSTTDEEQRGKDGTGGLLIVCANSIVNNHNITANGTVGGIARYSTNRNMSGGSSGGGSINIFYHGTYSNSGVVEAAGGQKIDLPVLTYTTPGGAGGAGSVTTTKIN